MYLTKDEIIEINSGKKYLILGCTKILEKEYYKICKIGEKLDELIGNCKYITVSKENGHLIRTGYLPRLHYLEIVDQYYCEVFKWKQEL